MLSVLLAAPLIFVMFTTEDLTLFYILAPLSHMFSSAWVGAAIATLQDLVLPRMRATAGATYILGTTMVGLALGPYFAGKMADVLQSLSGGIFSLYLIAPITLTILWLSAGRMAELESSKIERAREAGEAI
jgi:MFS family permease